MNHSILQWSTWHKIRVPHNCRVLYAIHRDHILVGAPAGPKCGTCTLPRCAQSTAERWSGEKWCWEAFLCNSPSVHHMQHSSRGISEGELLTQDSWRAPALFPSGRLKGILLQDTSFTIALFYIYDKIKFMQIYLLIWHISFLYCLCN